MISVLSFCCMSCPLWTAITFQVKELMQLERFSNDCGKTKTKAITPTNHNRSDSTMNQSQFLAITCNSLEAREKSSIRGAIGFGFDSHWLKNWHESFKPIT